MAETLWKWHLHLFAAESQNTSTNKNAMADCLANNESYGTRAQELIMFDSARKYSVTGILPVQMRGISVPTKQAMRDCLETFLAGLSQARWFGVRVSDGTLIASNSAYVTIPTANWTYDDSLDAINAERLDNLQSILLEILS